MTKLEESFLSPSFIGRKIALPGLETNLQLHQKAHLGRSFGDLRASLEWLVAREARMLPLPVT